MSSDKKIEVEDFENFVPEVSGSKARAHNFDDLDLFQSDENSDNTSEELSENISNLENGATNFFDDLEENQDQEEEEEDEEEEEEEEEEDQKDQDESDEDGPKQMKKSTLNQIIKLFGSISVFNQFRPEDIHVDELDDLEYANFISQVKFWTKWQSKNAEKKLVKEMKCVDLDDKKQSSGQAPGDILLSALSQFQ